jgi:citrate lyase gamma subunit
LAASIDVKRQAGGKISQLIEIIIVRMKRNDRSVATRQKSALFPA